MTDTYEGPATLVIGTEETAVMAVLHAPGGGTAPGNWTGTVQADGLQTSFWPAVQSGGVEIRMPDGRRGTAQIDMDAESGNATVSGTGPAPF
ncbi:DUF4873 domain-containing protein [Streptomyces sp. NBC_01218]|uniref:DUF4873 domain-containing protein n=1 Tax=unclassified Streptomyces TaxID=2593676 RepID=UPI0023B9F554|nr:MULTISPECIES: DUF4873 domain-containing protein [unclassified Streptomyces]WEH38258.1 DUF4873 domain-containing protein [Streptomyces sp. AM 2-1-1]WSQ49920.1 DUF4873 domain-containing protein [Streptomyces sp. NBC_01218]